MKRNTRNAGYAVLWILVTLASIAAVVSSIEFTIENRPHNPTMFWIFGVSLMVALAGLIVQAKRDLYSFFSFTMVFGALVAMITGAVAIMDTSPHPVAAAIATVMSAVSLGSLSYLLWTQLGSGRFPNVLKQSFPGVPLYEIDGVQFLALQSAVNTHASEPVEITVAAQNCWNAERVLVFKLEMQARMSLNRAKLVFEEAPELRLSAAEVALLHIPVVAEPGAAGTYSLVAAPRVLGRGGVRVRRRRVQTLPTYVPPWMTALGVLGGFLVWGGGMKFPLTVRQDGDPASGQVDGPLPVRAEVIWRPDSGDLEPTTSSAT